MRERRATQKVVDTGETGAWTVEQCSKERKESNTTRMRKGEEQRRECQRMSSEKAYDHQPNR